MVLIYRELKALQMPRSLKSERIMKFPSGNFDNEQLNILQSALELTCEEIGIAKSDNTGRRRIATVLMDLAKVGELNLEVLKDFAVKAYGKRVS